MRWLEVAFGAGKDGLSTVGFRLYDNTGTTTAARTTTGVVELVGGSYGVNAAVPEGTVGIEWDTGDTNKLYSHESLVMMLRVDELWQLAGLDINEPMTVTPTTRAVGDVDLAITGDGVTTTTVTRQ